MVLHRTCTLVGRNSEAEAGGRNEDSKYRMYNRDKYEMTKGDSECPNPKCSDGWTDDFILMVEELSWEDFLDKSKLNGMKV